MRILQVCAVDFTAFHLLGPLIRACREHGWDVEFACSDGPGAARLRDEGFVHHAIPSARRPSPFLQLRASLGLATILRRDPPDLIHTHTPVGGLVGRVAALGVARVPVVHTFHGLPFVGDDLSRVETGFLWAERVLSRRTAFFFSQARGDAERAVHLGIADPERLLVIGNGVDVERFAPDPLRRRTKRAAFGWADKDVVVVTTARLVREKGLLDLADSALRLSHVPALRYLIVGDALPSDRTSVKQELRRHAVAGRLGQRWELLGHREDVADLLTAADIFVLPSWREGLPRSVIEAMASGLPVVATDIPACRELVDEGVTGLLVPVRDQAALARAIARLADAPERRADMGARARERAIAEHDEREVVDRQLQVFDRLVGSRR